MNIKKKKQADELFVKATISMPPADKLWLSKRAKQEKKSLSTLVVELCRAERDMREMQISSVSDGIEQLQLTVESVNRTLQDLAKNQNIPAAVLLALCYQRAEEMNKRSGTADESKIGKDTDEAVVAFLGLGKNLMKKHGVGYDG
jgi:hypothetical protein